MDYLEEARAKGARDYKDGYLDKDHDNPFEAGTRSYEAWRLGWDEEANRATRPETAFERAWRLGRDIMSPPDRNR